MHIPSSLEPRTKCILPRLAEDTQTATFRICHTINSKGYYLSRQAHPVILREALQWLKQHNEFYSRISIGPVNYSRISIGPVNILAKDPTNSENVQMLPINSKQTTMGNTPEKDLPTSTVLTQDYLEDTVLLLAPTANNKILWTPKDILGLETEAFPNLFSSGTGMYSAKRLQRRTPILFLTYLRMHLLHSDQRWVNCHEYIFCMQAIAEKNAIMGAAQHANNIDKE